MTIFLTTLTLLFPLILPGQAEPYIVFVGKPTIIDGDTLILSNERIRLASIDAPESKQPCADAEGRPYRCGLYAAQALRKKIGSAEIRCIAEARGRYGRPLAECYLGEENLNHWLVVHGFAVAYSIYSQRYVAAEENAKAQKRGIWAGRFQLPWEWRQEHPQRSR